MLHVDVLGVVAKNKQTPSCCSGRGSGKPLCLRRFLLYCDESVCACFVAKQSTQCASVHDHNEAKDTNRSPLRSSLLFTLCARARVLSLAFSQALRPQLMPSLCQCPRVSAQCAYEICVWWCQCDVRDCPCVHGAHESSSKQILRKLTQAFHQALAAAGTAHSARLIRSYFVARGQARACMHACCCCCQGVRAACNRSSWAPACHISVFVVVSVVS